MPTSPDDLVDTYLRAITTADAELAVSLFSVDGVVHSPLYGSRPAVEFYPALFADTSQANLMLKSVMTGEDQTGATTVSFWFHFDWRLPSGAAAQFDVADVATLAPDGKIKDLHILYDTVDVRPAFEADVGRSTWRESLSSPTPKDLRGAEFVDADLRGARFVEADLDHAPSS